MSSLAKQAVTNRIPDCTNRPTHAKKQSRKAGRQAKARHVVPGKARQSSESRQGRHSIGKTTMQISVTLDTSPAARIH